MKKSLSGIWRLKSADGVFDTTAIVPGTDFGNLTRNGFIDNPLTSGDEKYALSIAENDFSFSRTFSLDEDFFNFERITINCNCLDTLCKCFINGVFAFESDNAFLPLSADVKQLLKVGDNEIIVQFYSPYKYIKERQKSHPLPKNFNGVDGIPYIRKPACHFGWDWGPCVPYSGICDDIFLKAFNRQIEDVHISQQTEKEKSVITASAKNADKITLVCPDGKTIDFADGKAVVQNPELWFTHEMSGKDVQPLYTVVFENAEEAVEKKIGLRNLRLDRSKDEYGEDFAFILNGERVFAKGANLIPFSAIFEDANDKTIEYYVDLALKSNFNILRVWGGGSYASEKLLSLCDEKGILVWQDFCFACQMYPFDDNGYLENVLEEVKSNVKRMTTHACLCLWCGNNEIETMFPYFAGTKLMKEYEKFFYHVLPETIKYLTEVDYIPTSPVGEKFLKKTGADECGDTHLWSVWHGLKKLDYYKKRHTRFLSEFGLESLPSMSAIKTFAKDEKDFNITSPIFNAHQKCKGGNRKMTFYLLEMFDFPKHFEDLPYLTGITQAKCVRDATIHFRQNKGRCNGSIFWQFNDVWACPSWSSVDFLGVPKALQYGAKRFFAPVSVTCKKKGDKITAFVHNDTLTVQNVDIKIETCKIKDNETEEIMHKKIEIKANDFERLCEFKSSAKAVRITVNGSVQYEVFSAPNKLGLEKVNFDLSCENGVLKVRADKFAYGVCLQADGVVFDENYVHIGAGETFEVPYQGRIDDVKITCANNVEFSHNKFKKIAYRLAFRLIPENVINYIVYSVI